MSCWVGHRDLDRVDRRQRRRCIGDGPVWTGDTILTPLAVTEDSRCPINARCVWAGKLTVSARIAATHWAQTAPLTLGEPYEVMGRTYVLVSATPGQTTDREIPAGEYRFIFEKR